METMIPKYVTASHTHHVTFPRVFPMGHSILSLHYLLVILPHHVAMAGEVNDSNASFK